MAAGSVFLPAPGFVPNADDGMSCMHACVQMLTSVYPGRLPYSFVRIDQILRRQPGLYSWEFAIYNALSHDGFDVRMITQFSIERFVAEGEKYLLKFYGPEAGQIQIQNSEIPAVREDAEKFLRSKSVAIETRIPEIDDIRLMLGDGRYAIATVNAEALNRKPGYSGHFILLYGFDAEGVFCHDPGFPAFAARHVLWEVFDEAWSSPHKSARSISGFKKRQAGKASVA